MESKSVHIDSTLPLFTEALFTIASLQNLPIFQSVDARIKKTCHIKTVVYSSAITVKVRHFSYVCSSYRGGRTKNCRPAWAT